MFVMLACAAAEKGAYALENTESCAKAYMGLRRSQPRGPAGQETMAAAIEGGADSQAQRAGMGKIVLASLVGTTIEFYDFYIFGTAAALVFGAMFFPKSAPETQALNAYLTFGIAFLARPVGSFLFGHFGDRVGRKSALVATMLTMGVATTLIGALPGYATAGVLAPVAPRGAALPAGRGLRRRVGRRGADCGRKRARKDGAPGSACFRSSGRRSASSSRPACSSRL